MSRRRVWVIAAVVLALAAALALRAWSDSESDAGQGTAHPSSSPSIITDTSPSTSPVGSASPTPTPTSSPSTSPTTSAAPSTKPTPLPTSSIAEDGLPIVTISRPRAGANVRLPLQLTGTAVAFEAVLRLEIKDRHGKVIAKRPAYADVGAPERGHWEVEVELPPGSYIAIAYVESPKDGSRIAEARVKFSAG